MALFVAAIVVVVVLAVPYVLYALWLWRMNGQSLHNELSA